MRAATIIFGLCLVASLWLSPLPELAGRSFSAHMALHMLVVAVIAPLLVFGLAGTRFDPVKSVPALFSPFLASAIEFIVIWAWHVPAMHFAAKQSAALFALEMGSYLAVGLLLWFAAFGGGSLQRQQRAAAGIAGLLLTSMHMALLGVLLALASQPLYVHSSSLPWGLTPLQDQQIGGVIMLSFGGSIYLVGGLYLLAGLLRDTTPPGIH